MFTIYFKPNLEIAYKLSRLIFLHSLKFMLNSFKDPKFFILENKASRPYPSAERTLPKSNSRIFNFFNFEKACPKTSKLFWLISHFGHSL